ncbi:antitoxin [Mycobacterium asiaticum]|uniref:Antitoxin n=1 Tax=Mycobacterium asiaticum TaxID=1790 RepID=A0A1A3UE96_MYCAS|nr:antitoxin [Mycobacterium asiaticum]OBK22672.1 antitoxin [Mycobacterium asiaticum]OBK93308.1 antitoxin [Mycobacterium asiaticum]
MRTTIDLPADLHMQALTIARDTGRTLNDTVVDLVRRALNSGSVAAVSTEFRTGFPLVSLGTIVTSADVRSLEDEA